MAVLKIVALDKRLEFFVLLEFFVSVHDRKMSLLKIADCIEGQRLEIRTPF